MYRQLLGISKMRSHVICWERRNSEQFHADGIPVTVLPYDAFPELRITRWLQRAANSFSGNFYGATGAERARLRRLICEERPYVALCQYGHQALRILPAAEKCALPVIAHFHGVDISAGLRNRWYRLSLRNALPRFAAAIVVADYQRDILVELGLSPQKIWKIPCGAPIPAALPSVQSADCRFVTVGRFVSKKAPMQTVRAFDKCAQIDPQVSLTMIGDGPLLQPTRVLVNELGLDSRVTFLGAQSPEKVSEELSKSSVFLQHSVTSENGDKEGWPVSIAEAMSYGLPVVATKHGGILDQVVHGESGFLVEENDWSSMGDRMLELAQSPELRSKFGADARQRAVDQFDQIKMIRKLEDVMLAVASEKTLANVS